MQSIFVETGLQLISRLNNRPSIDNLDHTLFSNQLKSGETVEISGNVSSGKTFLITQLLSHCVLPTKTADKIAIEGLNAEAVLIDTDHHFRISTITKMMRNSIIQSYKSVNKIPSEEIINDTVKSALENLTIINCYNRLQFRLSILSMENMLLHNENVALIVIDGITAFYWEDRDQDNIWLKDSYLKTVLNFVQKYTTLLHKASLIYTISTDFMPVEKDYLTWSSVASINHRINLFRSDLNEFRAIIKSNNCEEKVLQYDITESDWKWL